jgi:hypothetical protein
VDNFHFNATPKAPAGNLDAHTVKITKTKLSSAVGVPSSPVPPVIPITIPVLLKNSRKWIHKKESTVVTYQ